MRQSLPKYRDMWFPANDASSGIICKGGAEALFGFFCCCCAKIVCICQTPVRKRLYLGLERGRRGKQRRPERAPLFEGKIEAATCSKEGGMLLAAIG